MIDHSETLKILVLLGECKFIEFNDEIYDFVKFSKGNVGRGVSNDNNLKDLFNNLRNSTEIDDTYGDLKAKVVPYLEKILK